jgi:hypothetical protein
MGLHYLTEGVINIVRTKSSNTKNKNMPRDPKLRNILKARKARIQRGVTIEWMKDQFSKMIKLNQGLVSMSLGK